MNRVASDQVPRVERISAELPGRGPHGRDSRAGLDATCRQAGCEDRTSVRTLHVLDRQKIESNRRAARDHAEHARTRQAARTSRRSRSDPIRFRMRAGAELADGEDAIAPNAPIGAVHHDGDDAERHARHRRMKARSVWPRSPRPISAKPNRIENSRTWRISPCAKAPTTVSGMMCRKKSTRLLRLGLLGVAGDGLARSPCRRRSRGRA